LAREDPKAAGRPGGGGGRGEELDAEKGTFQREKRFPIKRGGFPGTPARRTDGLRGNSGTGN